MNEEQKLLQLISDYSKTFSLLNDYDNDELKEIDGTSAKFVLKYEDCLDVIKTIKGQLIKKEEAGELFGSERDQSFEGIIATLYQTFDGQELYQTIEDKAAHLLYFIIKDHPFSDGNKRIGSFLFIYFLDKNEHLYNSNGERKINDNALTALALLTAVSNPKDKEIMIPMITHLIKKG